MYKKQTKGYFIMNKTDLVNVVMAETSLPEKDVKAVINATLAAVSNALKEGDKVQLLGFGTFETKEVEAREGRNPKTGEAIKIDAHKKAHFTSAQALKDHINE
jgi:DNA-binding protein HU-beta